MPTPLPAKVRENLPLPSKEKSTAKWILILGSLCALPAVAGDLYLSALPTLVGEFSTTEEMTQLTIAITWVGAGFGQLLVGALSDRFGRKRPLLIGLFVHIVMSVCCALSGSIWQLMIYRFFQGAANASANVSAMAINRDLFTGKNLAKMLSRLVLVIGVAPLFAPMIGSLILLVASWRFIFVLLALVGIAEFLMVWFLLPDTHDRSKRIREMSLGKIFSLYGQVIKDKAFVAYAVNNGFVSTALCCWVIGAPFIVETEWGLSPIIFSIIFAINGLFLVGGAQFNAHMVGKFEPNKILKWSQISQDSLIIITVFLAWIIQLCFPSTVGIYLLPLLFLIIFLVNPVNANSNSIALSDKGALAGTASGFIGVLNCIIPAVVSPLVGFLGNTFLSMSGVMLISVLVGTIFLFFGTTIYKGSSKVAE